MKKALINIGLITVLALIVVVLWSGVGLAGQAESGNVFKRGINFINENRQTWDLIMRWVNFIILAVVIIKYARAPLAQFLKEKRAETSLTIKQLEEKKAEAKLKIRDGQIQLKSSQDKLALIKERILAEGQKRKDKIIEEARQESRLMLATAQVKIENQIRDAAEKIKIELIDMAVQRAEARLPQLLVRQDHNRLIEQWMDAARQ
ncbi:MAG: ATP synthase F0 subunit B [Desulfobacteraceae bacterium]|jgi:F-type H+-transporting ATPase subunit b